MAILELLYSENEYKIEELIKLLNPKNIMEKIEYYIMIEFATKLGNPVSKEDVSKLLLEQSKLLIGYDESDYFLENTLKIAKLKVDFCMLHFNQFMSTLRDAYQTNKNSPGGIVYTALLNKKGPLSDIEVESLNENYKPISALDVNISSFYWRFRGRTTRDMMT